MCGVWGGIATGIFGDYDLGVQVLGSVVIPLWAFVTMGMVFGVMKVTGNLRVSEEEEASKDQDDANDETPEETESSD